MRTLTLSILILLGGCSYHRTGRLDPARPGGGDRELPRNRPETLESSWSQKVVNAKEEPATLIAADRTRCTVSAQKFKETVVGTQVWCLWR